MSSNPEHIDEVLAKVPQKVTEEMNNILIATFMEEEVEKALKQMEPLKSLGPDGMPLYFFKVIGLWWEKMLKKLS